MKSYAKANIFLKITGTRGSYHELSSRFILIESIFDEIELVKKTTDEIILNDKIPNNIILKAKKILEKIGFEKPINDLFLTHQIKLIKNIPQGSGLGGASSNAAAFLHLINESLNLKMKKEKLMQISEFIGADVAFFTSGYKSANVSGIGEIVNEFNDEIPELKFIQSKISCSTQAVFTEFRANFFKTDKFLFKTLSNMTSSQILNSYPNYELNDLLHPCIALYPNLKIGSDEFLSGSGSTKFSVLR